MKKSLLVIACIFILCSISYAAKFSFAVFSDKQDRDPVFNDLIGVMNQDKSIIFAINAGDLTDDGSQAEYDKYWLEKTKATVKIYDVIGNHDRGNFNLGYNIFKKKYGFTYSYFDQDDCRFILIDNSSGKGLGEGQWSWLKKTLSTKKMKFVFMHKPLFDPSGTYTSHVMAPQREVKKLQQLFIDNGVKYVITGHIHGYSKEDDGAIVYIVTAGAGASLYLPHFNGGFYHYVKITVDNDKISDEVVKIYND
jgi:3',5'-cyclic AMP phosphodiesterase CpdA